MFSREYSFGLDEIKATDYYNESTGYGFIDFDKIEGPTDSYKALKAGNWNKRQSDGDNWKTAFNTLSKGVEINTSRHVMVFRATVPSFGTYKVNVCCTAGSPVNNLTIYTGRRNLVSKNISIDSGEKYISTFYTHVTPYIPALSSKPDESKDIYVSISGENVVLLSIEIQEEKVKTIFIAGDSTLTDQNALTPYYPICSCAGWAQDLLMFTNNIAVCNYAHSGLTTNCFKDDGHWDILKNHIKPGDIFLIQFGHNDQKRRNLAAFGGYINNLKWYVKEVRKLGGFPIICSPISRVPISDDEETYSLLKLHSLACKEAANECKTPFIDLHDFTFDKWTSMSDQDVRKYFIPGDITHTNDYGAILIAKYVAKCLSSINELTSYIIDSTVKNFTPDTDTLEYPKEPAGASPFDIKPPFIDFVNIRKQVECEAAYKKGLMDPCVMYMHPTSIMPRAQLLMIYLRAIKLNGTRPYLGKYIDVSKYEWDSSYLQTCINENLIDETTVQKDLFRPDDALTYEEFASFCIRGLIKDKLSRDVSIDDCFDKAISLGLIDNDVNPKAYIERQDVYAGLSKVIDISDNTDRDLPSDTEMHPVH